MKRLVLFVSISFLLLMGSAEASSFNSGSTGALGAFNPTANIEVTLPPDGILNYTTVNIPAGVTVTFKKNAANTPVYILATGDVIVNGTIDVSGKQGIQTIPGEGGPGGFSGGFGGATNSPGGNGIGPGGGGGGPNYSYSVGGGGGFGTQGGSWGSNHGAGGSVYGNSQLVPLIGGSGGGGQAGTNYEPRYGGGGGGGAVLIASSGSISVAGSIIANGGSGYGSSGAGSGGAIKLMSNSVSGNGIISAKGGWGRDGWINGGAGRIRIEAFINLSLST